MKAIPFAAVAAAALALASCTTLKNGTHQAVIFTSSPSGAFCEISRESSGMLRTVVTPQRAYIRRSSEPLTVTCKASGHQTASVTVGSDKDNHIVGNLGFKLIGAPVDFLGNSHHLMPAEVNVRLQPDS